MEKLKIVDLTYDCFKNIDENDELLVYLIMNEFSEPNEYDEFKYLPTQYISEYIKNLDIDGIKYNSSLYSKGRNYVIFNYEKCKATSSNLYKLNDICLDAECIEPPHINRPSDVYHWRLSANRKENNLNNNLQKCRIQK